MSPKVSYLIYCSHNNICMVSICVIVELCSTTDVRDENNMTLLHWACFGGNKDVVQYLVEELKMDVGEI